MPGYKFLSFGDLTNPKQSDSVSIENKENKELDYLFKNLHKKLENFKIINLEREKAMDNLRTLTSQLQTKRIHKKLKDKYEIFKL